MEDDTILRRLSEEVKHSTWLIRASYESKPGIWNYFTGFAIKVEEKNFIGLRANEVVIMTIAYFLEWDDVKIEARRFEDHGFINNDNGTKIVILKKDGFRGMALLAVEVDNGDSMCGELAHHGVISDCETLVHVGHTDRMVWSVMVGRAAHSCVDECVDSLGDFDPLQMCLYYDSTNCNKLNFRIMGHIFDKNFFESNQFKTEGWGCERMIQATTPIIQCFGLEGVRTNSGGPVFNQRGKIVGMNLTRAYGYEVAIHVSALKEFVKEFVSAGMIKSISEPLSSIVKPSIAKETERERKHKGKGAGGSKHKGKGAEY